MTTDPTEAIRLIQTGLDNLGHSPGVVDSQWGVRTAHALRQLIAANRRPILDLGITPASGDFVEVGGLPRT